ncbi:MAG TPA: amino acid permease [Saprospiraceae bacterium]|nr:amino acid permease [Saprospiraceae bacterium]HNT22540.1 amino acid permease [Saprospiraceae bacterium]
MTQLNQRITLYGLTMIAVGSSIGSGIFVTPGTIAQEIPNAWLILLVWLLGGLVGLCGALTFSELGSLFTRSGGVYVYLRHAYGPLAGFLYGWVMLVVINTGSLAGLCVAFAEYLKFFLPGLSQGMKMAVAAGTMVILTGINILGVHYSQWLSNVLTTLKVGAILIIVIIGLFAGNEEVIRQNFNLAAPVPGHLFTALFSGMIGVFFSVGGWHHATYVAGEVINPGKNVARAMILGTGVITLAYVTINLAYLRLLPVESIAGTQTAASDAVSTVFPWAGRLVAIGIALSIFGTISIYTMSAPRIYFAMAEDGLFFKPMARVHPRWRTPVTAMLVQAVWALCILFFFQAYFDRIITFVTFMDALFFALAAASVFVFRNKLKGEPRPYRVWGYPVIPLVFIILYTVFAMNIFFQKPQQAIPGLVLMGLGIGLYYWFSRIKREIRE